MTLNLFLKSSVFRDAGGSIEGLAAFLETESQLSV